VEGSPFLSLAKESSAEHECEPTERKQNVWRSGISLMMLMALLFVQTGCTGLGQIHKSTENQWRIWRCQRERGDGAFHKCVVGVTQTGVHKSGFFIAEPFCDTARGPLRRAPAPPIFVGDFSLIEPHSLDRLLVACWAREQRCSLARVRGSKEASPCSVLLVPLLVWENSINVVV